MKVPDVAMTHGGKFHADDVFSSALLRILNPDIRFMRVFEVSENYDGLVFDIGWGKFDHHQRDAKVRPNGTAYAAFGLLWQEFGAELVGGEEASRMDEYFVQPLDRDDNTGCGSALADVIGSFNPNWDSEEDTDVCFEEAVQFATTLLKKKLETIWSIQRARKLVEEAFADMQDGIVVLPRFAPWKQVLVGTGADFIVYPSQRGGFSAQGIPADRESSALKFEFPAEWAGKPEEELAVISGIKTLRFCHNNRFLISTGTQEDAILACKLTRGENV